MGIGRDLAFITRVVSSSLKNRPSAIEKRENFQRLKQAGYTRGFEYGLQKARMYYPGAETGILQNDWATSLKSITSIIASEFSKLCARSELAVRTDAVAKRAQQVLNTFIVGQGNKPFPAVRMFNGEPVEGVNRKLSDDWERFNDQGIRTSTIDMTMYQAQSLEFNSIFTYGSSLAKTVSAKRGSWLPYSFQLISPTRLDFSKDNYISADSHIKQPPSMIVHGIEMSGSYPDPQAFYLSGVDNKISASEMTLAFYQQEVEQYLGLPWLTPVLPQIWDNQQLFMDKLKQSRIGARLGMKMPKEDQAGVNALLSNDGNGGEYFDLDYQGFYFSNGEPKPISITDPISDTFEALVKLTCLYIAVGLGISYGTLTSDLNNSNFSAARSNTIIENRLFRTLYKWFVKTVCQRRWEKFVEWEFLTGKMNGTGVGYAEFLKDPWYYTQCYWLPLDGEDWIDPLKDQEALLLAYKMGQVTYQELCAMKGKGMSGVIRQLKKEREELVAAGLDNLLPENVDKKEPVQNASEKKPQENENVNKS